MNIVIASDFHLRFQESGDDRKRRERVIRFLESLRGTTDLLILNGDVFDLWLEWDNVVIAGYEPVYEALRELVRSGCRIVMTPGNHDFLFGRFLPDRLGVEVVKDAFTGVFDGKRIHVSHGDPFTANDLRYQLYRRAVRSGLARAVIRLLHPDLTLRLGMGFSRTSRRVRPSAEYERKRAAGLENTARRMLRNFDIVVFSHSHIPLRVDFDQGVYLNSGDWVRHRTCVRITDGVPELIDYHIEEER